ncbi:angiogenic factor with G patch and FHA domains 1-like isoform X2 [Spodoptera litura]|uniref:Angiogenic factor with G patch and FHA domains 1-like isoform X2 n=1 Tax=Spodoptera litura TaxID=69820 RepID=A0A9J7ESD5_SPOLT|nr:angiogenic factor with G patch and FHA domains 1-like isoform X2 [Spodoptera litura]
MDELPVYIPKKRFNLRKLRLALKYRPVILRLILKLRSRIKEKHRQLLRLKLSVEDMVTSDFYQAYLKATHGPGKLDITPEIGVNTDEIYSRKNEGTLENKKEKTKKVKTKSIGTQTEEEKTNTKEINNKTDRTPKKDETEHKVKDSGWSLNDNKETKSIAEQVAEVAQDALKESGMVYVESAGMYYDYKTGYYYNSELGLYYHTDTQCYYYYSEDKKCFEFHSYPDRSATNEALIAHEKKKAKKHKMDKEAEENDTKNPKRKKQIKKKKKDASEDKKTEDSSPEVVELKVYAVTDEKESKEEQIEESVTKLGEPEEMEDGECSDTSSSSSDDDDDDVKSNASTSTATDDESVAKHHPPCMRVIVRETKLPKLRVGNLFIITKDGGTVGREGEQHIILLKDHNVSRTHLDIKFDPYRNLYMMTDLGSKNGTILNGTRMSESQVRSEPMEVVHGSTIQIGETKLLCHIHPGNDTCGHCEPGLLMEALEKEKKVAYTRTCSVQKQHQLELARLKNKYAPKPPLAIEETAYNDRAQARRETVGSSHHSEKTQSTDINTSIAAENKGFKLLEKMGWNKGEGLGKDSQGETEPVPLVSNEGTAGLGAGRAPFAPIAKNSLGPATMRLATRTKMLNPPAKAFQSPIDDEDSE